MISDGIVLIEPFMSALKSRIILENSETNISSDLYLTNYLKTNKTKGYIKFRIVANDKKTNHNIYNLKTYSSESSLFL